MRGRTILLLAVGWALVFPATALAQFSESLDRVDELIDEEEPDAAISDLESLEATASTPAERAEVYWRMASALLMRGDQRKDAGAGDDELLEIYAEGEEYGRRAVEADPQNHLGYYWESANIGRWGQTKGVLNSLFRAPDMRDLLSEAITREPDFPESYYVLGQLYAKVPGVVSFGNTEYAVSLGRKSVDLMEAEIRSGDRDERSEAFYVQLASHLIDRGWNSRRRGRGVQSIRRDYNSASSPVDRGLYYEGAVSIPSTDDKSEAREILDGVIRRLGGLSSPSPSERRQLEEARELRSGL
jgi:tetratricopeptide (TPR) repeat protein